jgi:hypothetical protein
MSSHDPHRAHESVSRAARRVALVTVVGLVVAIATVLPVVSASAETVCTPTGGRNGCIQFTYTGADQSFRVPNGVTQIVAFVYGAQGGDSVIPQSGGLGGQASGTIATSPGTLYTVSVGARGDAGTYGGGGVSGAASRQRGGSGGGLSALWSGASFVAGNALIVAGGGGGSAGSLPGANVGGGGGGLTGGSAGTGAGGTQSAGGSAATVTGNSVAGSAGVQFRGGDSAATGDSGGAGGSGWFGGGAGLGQVDVTLTDTDTSGGGGSGFLSAAVSSGSMSSGVRSGAGLVVIEFVVPQTVISSPANGTVHGSFALNGTGAPGNTLTATIQGSPVCTTTVASDGSWTCGTFARPPGSYTISAVETDPGVPLVVYPAGAASITVVAPSAPAVNPTAGVTVTGTADAGTTVEVRNSSATLLGTGIAAPDGSFVITLSPVQPHGSVLSVTAADTANTSAATQVTVDSLAPGVPLVDPTTGHSVSGSAEPGATVVVRDSSGTVVGTTVAASDGSFTAILSPVQPHGEVLSVRAVDASGNTSAPASVTVDTVAPAAPTLDPSDGHTVSGSAEPGAAIEVRDPSGVLIGTGTAGPGGLFTVTLTPVQPDGAVLSVVAIDATGNRSPAAEVTVDAIAPGAPVVDPTDGRAISGLAEPGATVTVRDPSGTVIGSGTAGPGGVFAFPLSPTQPDGAVLSVVASDAAGNVSGPTQVTVDAVPPAAPAVDPSDGTVVSGTAEPGATVVVYDPSGAVIGTTTAAGDGSFSVVLSPARADGEVLGVTATDAAGNESPATHVTVDAVLPAAPLVNPTNGHTVTGTAEPGATVDVRDSSGALLGSGPAAVDGSFSIVLSPAAPEGTLLSVTASDAAGNTSAPTSVTVDALPPAAPSVDPSNGRTVTGSAEPGARVEVRDDSGALLGTALAGPDGSFVVTLSPAAADGSELSVTATDVAGNTSLPTTVIVDAAAPAAPALDPSDGRTVSGTADPGSHLVVRNPSGATLGEGLADASGAFTIVLNPAQNDGVVLSVTAGDDLGNVSPASTVTVHIPAPSPPTDVVCVENPSGTVTCSGSAEPGFDVEVRDGDDEPVCSAVVAADGSWSCTSSGPVERRPLSITITDPRGPATVVDDVPVRGRPVVLASTGLPVLGVAAAGFALSAFGCAVFAIRRRRSSQPRAALTTS